MSSGRKRPAVHGHRGCRGYSPENTIPAFLKAIALGVDAIELDIVVTGDKQILVSHEPWFSPEICLNPDGRLISHLKDSLPSIYKLPYEQIRRYDCGSKPHPRFPEQVNIAACKPLLSDVIDATENFTTEQNLPAVTYNVEIKSYPEGDGIYHPAPPLYTDLLMEVLQTKGVSGRTMIQSFDVRPLQELYTRYHFPRLGLLVEDQVPVEQHLNGLGFLPFAYNPHYSLVNHKLITYLKKRHIQIYTWTVNTAESVQELIRYEVDGIITDYPLLIMKELEISCCRL